jgi:ABC-type transporter Mla subunit MlaD
MPFEVRDLPSVIASVAVLVAIVVWAVRRLKNGGNSKTLEALATRREVEAIRKQVSARTGDGAVCNMHTDQIGKLFNIVESNSKSISVITADLKVLVAVQKERKGHIPDLIQKIDQLTQSHTAIASRVEVLAASIRDSG